MCLDTVTLVRRNKFGIAHAHTTEIPAAFRKTRRVKTLVRPNRASQSGRPSLFQSGGCGNGNSCTGGCVSSICHARCEKRRVQQIRPPCEWPSQSAQIRSSVVDWFSVTRCFRFAFVRKGLTKSVVFSSAVVPAVASPDKPCSKSRARGRTARGSLPASNKPRGVRNQAIVDPPQTDTDQDNRP